MNKIRRKERLDKSIEDLKDIETCFSSLSTKNLFTWNKAEQFILYFSFTVCSYSYSCCDIFFLKSAQAAWETLLTLFVALCVINWTVLLTDSAKGPIPRAGVHWRGEWRSDHSNSVPQRRHQTQIHRPLLHPSGLRRGRLWLWWATQHGFIYHHFPARCFSNHTSHVFAYCLKNSSFSRKLTPF